MTKELKIEFVNKFGTGTGPTLYRHFRELAKVGNLPLEQLDNNRTAISDETIQAFNSLTITELNKIFREYRNQTTHTPVRLSEHGLTQIGSITTRYFSQKNS